MQTSKTHITLGRAPNESLARRWLSQVALSFAQPLRAGLLTAIIYILIALLIYPLLLGHASAAAYYNYLADAFLHGQLHLRVVPTLTRDLSLLDGNYYLYWGPLPAVLLAPLVALFGLNVSDTVFSIAIGALNVFLTAQVLRDLVARRVLRISRVRRGALVLVFAFGSVHLVLAVGARIWFTSLVAGYIWVALAYLAALRLRGWVAFACTGAAIGCALLTRTHLPLVCAWPVFYLLSTHRSAPLPRRLIHCLAGGLPVVIAFLISLLYNQLRFGSASENGISYQLFNPIFMDEIARYGLFNVRYMPANFFYQYIAYPFPWGENSMNGGSLFLLTPVFFAVFWAFTNKQVWPTTASLLFSILPTAIVDLTIIGGGWVQAGPRYTLDFTLPLLMLTAIGIRRWPSWLIVVTCIISIIHYEMALGL